APKAAAAPAPPAKAALAVRALRTTLTMPKAVRVAPALRTTRTRPKAPRSRAARMIRQVAARSPCLPGPLATDGAADALRKRRPQDAGIRDDGRDESRRCDVECRMPHADALRRN